MSFPECGGGKNRWDEEAVAIDSRNNGTHTRK